MTIVGIAEKSGVYEGNQFDNIIFQCTEPYEADKGIGVKVRSIKVKRKVLKENFGKDLSKEELTSLIGQTAEFFYDEYQNVKLIEIHQQTRK